MTDLKPNDHARIRRAFRFLDDQAPLGPDLRELETTTTVDGTPRRFNPAVVLFGAVLATLLLFVPIALLVSGSDPDVSPGGTPGAPAESPEPTEPAVDPDPDYLDRFPVVVEVEETGDLIGLERGHAFKSTDGGQTWREIVVHGAADLIDIAADGTLLAVGNTNETIPDVFGPNTWVREAPKVHIYDPVAGEWQTDELPRPDFPVDDPKPAPLDGSGGCGLAGIHWTWDALSIAIGDRFVIAGEQRIVEESLCDESFQFFWTSPEGMNWTITESTGIPGYMVGMTWFDGIYVAYGSDIPWYWSDPSRTLEIWTSGDLANWETAEIDLSVLPTNGYPLMFPDEEATFGLGNTVVSTVTDGVLRLNIPIGLAAPGPDPSIADIDELRQWAEANNRDASGLEDILEFLDIDFPLDEEEVENLTLYFHGDEGYGQLILETDDGVSWTRRYEDR